MSATFGSIASFQLDDNDFRSTPTRTISEPVRTSHLWQKRTTALMIQPGMAEAITRAATKLSPYP
jgi:hypothetical protein